MKRISIYATLALLFGTMCFGCGKGGGKMATDADSVAYVIGLNVGQNLLAMDSTLNVDAVCAAIRDVFDGEPKMSLAEGRDYLLAQKTYFVHEKAQAYQEQFLADLSKSDRSYVRMRNGVTYKITKLGDQSIQSMTGRDTVRLAYTIRGEAGDTIRPLDTIRVAYRDLVDGLQDVVKTAGDGGKFDAWLPSKTAYGEAGNADLGIAPDRLLRYEVDILKIDYYNKDNRR